MGGSQTYFPPLVGGVRGGGSKQLWQKGIRVFQIALIVVLFFRYGIARKDANVRWSNIAGMNEKVPLMIQALYPSFPEGAKICLQNMPTALNQRFNRAFEFQYPDAQAGGIYTRDFEECVQKETIETILAEYFFLYYKDGMIYDFTYETRERLTSQQRIDIRKLPRRPEYKLSAQTPDITFDFDTSARCSAIGIISSLANGIAVSQGTLIAHGEIEGLNGHVETFEIAAGQDTAEWAIRFPGVQPVVQHRMPTVYRSWNLQQPDGTMPVAQNYLKHVTFQEPFIPAKVSLKFVASPDTPSNLVLDIDRIVLYTEDPIEEQ